MYVIAVFLAVAAPVIGVGGFMWVVYDRMRRETAYRFWCVQNGIIDWHAP